jgi:hypothetical protein
MLFYLNIVGSSIPEMLLATAQKAIAIGSLLKYESAQWRNGYGHPGPGMFASKTEATASHALPTSRLMSSDRTSLLTSFSISQAWHLPSSTGFAVQFWHRRPPILHTALRRVLRNVFLGAERLWYVPIT